MKSVAASAADSNAFVQISILDHQFKGYCGIALEMCMNVVAFRVHNGNAKE